MKFLQLCDVKHRVVLGQALPFNVRHADGALLLARGQVLGSAEQLQALLARGALVDLAELRGPLARVLDAPCEMLPALWNDCMNRVGQTLKASSQPGFRTALDEVSAPVQSLIARDSDLAIFQVLRQQGNPLTEYGSTHSLHSAIAAFLLAQRLDWDATSQQIAFKAALTMNLSMLELHGQLAQQTAPLSAAQRQALHAHPQGSAQMLERAGITDRDWLRAVAEHHEAADGSGYPDGLREVSEIAALVRRADIYTAKLSARKGRDAMAADLAGRTMFMQEPGHPMSAALAKEFGIYPPGCYVKLASGETAVVVKRGATVTTPRVAALTTPNGVTLTEPQPRETSKRENAIACVIPSPSVRVQLTPEKLMRLALA